jgi:tetratricopeptide (TPR) repeat protein
MTAARWSRIQDIFGDALELEGVERGRYVDDACAGDTALRDEIVVLLATHEKPRVFLDTPLPAVQFLQLSAEQRIFRTGDLVSGRFRIERFLGEGGMGEVYAAFDLELSAMVALKTLRPELAAARGFAERLRREVHLARQVTHPNVCRVFDVGRDGETLYFTMELLEGETLEQRLAAGAKFTPLNALPIIQQLCDGLTAAHGPGIVHRDFKSANVMLAGDRAVITDFGLARLLETGGEQSAGLAIGTPAYMAPEQMEGAAVTPAADIYALGVVIFEMLTGEKPYQASSPLALAAKKVKHPPRSLRELADVPVHWEAAVRRCLAAKPEDRFAHAREVAAALEGQASVPEPARRIPWRPLAAAAVIALAAVGAWTLAPRFGQHTPPPEAVRWYRHGLDAMAEGAWFKASKLLGQAIAVDGDYIAAHARLAEVYSELDQGDRAKDEIIRAASLAPDRSALPVAEALLLEAAQASVARDFKKAADAYRARAGRVPPEERGQALLDQGRAEEKANLTIAAIATYQQATNALTQNERAHLHLGQLARRKNQPDVALEELRQAEEAFRLSSNLEGVTETMLARAVVYEETRRLKDAEPEFRAAMGMAAITGNVDQQIRSRFDLSRVRLRMGRADEARQMTEEAMAMAATEHADNLAVTGLNNVGDSLAAQSRWPEAEGYYQRAVVLGIRAKSARGMARAQLMMGQARMKLNDNDGALAHIEQAVKFYGGGGYGAQLEAALALSSEVQLAQGRYAEAEKNAKKLEEQANASQSEPSTLQALDKLLWIKMYQGDYRSAQELSARKAAIEGKSGRAVGQGLSLLNEAEAFWHLGRHREFNERIGQARAIVNALGKGGVNVENLLALVEAGGLLSQLRAAEARELAGKAMQAARGNSPQREAWAETVYCLAIARAGRAREGARLCATALEDAEETKVPAFVSMAMLALAEATFIAGDPTIAESLASAAREHSLKYGHREMALRALLVQWASQRRSGNHGKTEASAAAFAKESSFLWEEWGAGSLESYVSRPDIRALIAIQ